MLAREQIVAEICAEEPALLQELTVFDSGICNRGSPSNLDAPVNLFPPRHTGEYCFRHTLITRY